MNLWIIARGKCEKKVASAELKKCKFQNPRCARCYVNEDYMQVAQKLGCANRHAVIAARRSKGICTQYMYGLGLKLADFEKQYR